MESDHWPRVKEIFTEALDQNPDAREAFAHKACGADGPPLPPTPPLTAVNFLAADGPPLPPTPPRTIVRKLTLDGPPLPPTPPRETAGGLAS